MFDLKNEEYARDLLREGNVKYTKNNESIEQLLSQRRQVPKAMASNAFEKIIAEYEKIVKKKRSDRDSAISHFGTTYSWKETGYLLTNGKKLDFSGRHEGASGGYRAVS